MNINFQDVLEDKDIKIYIQKADESLKELGYTEHSFTHVIKVAESASYILRELGYSEREIELAKIAGYLQ